MSVKLFCDVNAFVSRAGRDLGLSPTEVALLKALAWHLNDQTGLCCPSEVTLARETLLHLSTVKRSLSGLARRGLLVRSKRKTHDGDGYSYRVTLPALPSDSSGLDGGAVLPTGSLEGGVVHRRGSHHAPQLVAPCTSVGGVTLPDKEGNKFKPSEPKGLARSLGSSFFSDTARMLGDSAPSVRSWSAFIEAHGEDAFKQLRQQAVSADGILNRGAYFNSLLRRWDESGGENSSPADEEERAVRVNDEGLRLVEAMRQRAFLEGVAL